MPESGRSHPRSAVAASRLRDTPVVLSGEDLTIEELVRVARHGAGAEISQNEEVQRQVHSSRQFILQALENNEPIYGVTTGFGAMAHVVIDTEDTASLQENLIRFLTAGAGPRLATEDVRASMLLRANSHLRGTSGLRMELVQRVVQFLNAGATPVVHSLGSIGASGDLIPLAYVAGAVFGLDAHYQVEFDGQTVSCLEVLRRLDLEPIRLGPKEGLAMVNGTSAMTGIAATCAYDARTLVALALGAHALYFQALHSSNQFLHPFIHRHKNHRGQVTAAELLLRLLERSKLIRDDLDGPVAHRGADPIQDRYSLRCAPQFLGPIIDSLDTVWRQLSVEMNSANDNPLIDADGGRSYHAGNFLGQYVGVAMDQLRYLIGMMAKHLDAQISLIVSPPFNSGLPPSLVGNQGRKVNMGLKGLQISGNSMMPLLCFLGNAFTPHFPTHAEEFNQNINSLGFGSAHLARQSIDIGRQYLAVALLFGIQGVDLRTFLFDGHYDARQRLSPASRKLYEAVRTVISCPPATDRPYLWNDDERFLDADIAAIAADLASGGVVVQAVDDLVEQLAGGTA